MNIELFIDFVSRMRKAQLDYYRDKYKVYNKLIAAKSLERQVDDALAFFVKQPASYVGFETFVDLVSNMRRTQLDYYRDKLKVYSKLIAAKNLERQVDAALRAGLKPVASAPTATQISFMEASDESKE